MSDNLEDLPGVGPATADKLLESGFDSYLGLAVASPSEIAEQSGVGDNKAGKIVRAARKEADIGGFNSGYDVMQEREEIGKISWRVPEIDKLLNGGCETRSITELYGEFGSGKSQVTHQLSVNVQLPPEHGGLSKSAIFIDTEDTFRPSRISEMVHGLHDDELAALFDQYDVQGEPTNEDDIEALTEVVLENIHVAKAYNSNHQMMLAEKALELAGEMEETDFPVGLVAIDSLTAHFRAEYVGRGELANRQQKLNKHLHDLGRIGELHNACILVTNQVSSNPDSFFGDPTQPIGGNILGHKSTFRLYLRKTKGTKRVIKLVDAPNLPDGEGLLQVEGEGLVPE